MLRVPIKTNKLSGIGERENKTPTNQRIRFLCHPVPDLTPLCLLKDFFNCTSPTKEFNVSCFCGCYWSLLSKHSDSLSTYLNSVACEASHRKCFFLLLQNKSIFTCKCLFNAFFSCVVPLFLACLVVPCLVQRSTVTR